MSKYLKTREGSLEDLAKQMQNKVLESDYQDKFKKELDKAGRPIGQMTGAEKKAFFNKLDKMHSAKNEQVKNPYAIGMAQAMKAKDDQPPLKKSTITKAHDIAKSIEKDQKEEVEINEADIPSFKKLVRDNNLTVKSKKRGYKGDTITISGSNSSIEKALKTMYGNDWRKVYKQQGSKYIEAQFKKDIKEEDAYQNDRFAVSGNSAKIDNANTSDKSNHVHAPNAKTAVAMYKAGVKSYKDNAEMRRKFPMAVEEVQETHSFITNKQNQKQKEVGGEKEPIKTTKNEWKTFAMMAAELREKKEQKKEDKKEMQAGDDTRDKKQKTMTGEIATSPEMNPKVDYKY
jgi:hypothetical protein